MVRDVSFHEMDSSNGARITSHPANHHEILVTDNLVIPGKRSAVHQIIQSVKDDLTLIDRNLAELAPGTSGQDVQLDHIGKTLQLLQSRLGDTVEYLPAYEQRLLQSRISSASRLLSERRNESTANQGFSFRRASKPGKSSKVAIDVVDIPDRTVISPINGNPASIRPAVPGNIIGLSDSCNVKKKFTREALRNKDVILSSLTGCKIFLEGSASMLNLKNLTDCLVLSGPIRTSVFLANCRNCTLVVACQQLRIHDSTDLQCYVHLTSGGIIEDTKNCAFAPYNAVYPGIDCDFVESNFRRDGNDHWQAIEDFNYVVSNKRSPNWTVIPESERKSFEDLVF